MTIPDLSGDSGLSKRYISYLEADEKEPTVRTVRALADALGPQAGAALVQAAFPDLRIMMPRSRKSATARERSYVILGSLLPTVDLGREQVSA